jgi:hypothetical protein
MNHFSSEYLYILQKSFEDDFWWSLLYTSPSLFFLLISICCILGIIFLILMLTFDKSEGRGRYKLAQGVAIFMVMLIPLSIGTLFFSYIGLPEFSYVNFKKEHSDIIYESFYKDRINNYKENPDITPSRLEHGAVNNYSWKVRGKYQELEKEIYIKIPDAKGIVIYNKAVYMPLNKMFLKCFDKDIKKPSKAMTIEQIQDSIGLDEENCLNKAVDQFINEVNIEH